jgi:hypothetical protein
VAGDRGKLYSNTYGQKLEKKNMKREREIERERKKKKKKRTGCFQRSQRGKRNPAWRELLPEKSAGKRNPRSHATAADDKELRDAGPRRRATNKKRPLPQMPRALLL